MSRQQDGLPRHRDLGGLAIQPRRQALEAASVDRAVHPREHSEPVHRPDHGSDEAVPQGGRPADRPAGAADHSVRQGPSGRPRPAVSAPVATTNVTSLQKSMAPPLPPPPSSSQLPVTVTVAVSAETSTSMAVVPEGPEERLL